ncbi:site-specific integrase [Thalassospira sp.]|uniref:tyrosine-type recombinase/integrase n=1 Tax=Thalassospira sp. TaxID=1912094 RepID=UPI001B2A588B|nr:site-specific integrase [Thalassospira sp.]MBO6809245.1 site-specific integrase [Thalassospira sp.]MBO6841204.1 site-specific integrase [Thalassospira sp.]
MANIRERTTGSGERKYRVEIRLRGYPRQSATFSRKTDAQRWATQTEAAILEGRHFKSAESKRRTFAELVEHYIETVVPVRHATPQASQTIQLHLTWWKEQLGAFLLADITPSRIAELRDKLLASPACGADGRPLLKKDGSPRRRKSPATVVRYLASLSVVFSTAANEWEWVDQNPVQKVRRPRESRGRVRFLSDDERERLVEACKASPNPYLYTVVIVALSTGARYGEIIGLKWRDIDLVRGTARLERTKNRERRALPLAHIALEAVKELHQEQKPKPSDFVFARADGAAPMEIRKHWYNAIEQAEIEDFRFHDLRHSAASYLAMNGATLAEIAEVLGHKTLQMVKRYAHLSDQHTAAVVERMNKKIFKTAR